MNSRSIRSQNPFFWTTEKENGLISEVKKNPVIYDVNHDSYRDRVYVDKIWKKFDAQFEMPRKFLIFIILN